MIHPFHRRPGISPRRRFYFLSRLFAVLAAIALAAASTVAAGTAAPPSERVLVTDVVDGDTIKVIRGHRQDTVRFIGVDTPETNRQGRRSSSMAPRLRSSPGALCSRSGFGSSSSLPAGKAAAGTSISGPLPMSSLRMAGTSISSSSSRASAGRIRAIPSDTSRRS